MMLLLSIRPNYVQGIFSGKKTVELRKRRPSVEDDTSVFIYSTSPVCEIVGSATISHIEIDSPASLWSRVQWLCGVNKAEYDEYFRGSEQSVGIFLKKPLLFVEPFSLETLRNLWPGFHPPQQFQYLDQSKVEFLFQSCRQCA